MAIRTARRYAYAKVERPAVSIILLTEAVDKVSKTRRRTAVYILALSTAVILVAWGISLRCTAVYFGAEFTLGIGYGNLIIEMFAYDNTGFGWVVPNPVFDWSYMVPWASWRTGDLELSIPFWIPFVIVAPVPTLAFFRGPLARWRFRQMIGAVVLLLGWLIPVCVAYARMCLASSVRGQSGAIMPRDITSNVFLTIAGAWLMAAIVGYRRGVRFVAPHSPGTCHQCGYDLSGLPTPTCPECGRDALDDDECETQDSRR